MKFGSKLQFEFVCVPQRKQIIRSKTLLNDELMKLYHEWVDLQIKVLKNYLLLSLSSCSEKK